uniref:RNA methyltransferase n=1 Tax=Anopheles darlingi TaxID=43151 RepID=A0A2M4CVQ4_ANODA
MEENQIKHGNYHKYYEFRPEDTRSGILKRSLAELWKARKAAPESGDDECIFLLDVGCNRGLFTAKVKTIVQEVTGRKVCATGVDIDPVLCEQAASSVPDVNFLCGNLLEIASSSSGCEDPIDSHMQRLGIGQFDVVCCFSVLMYVHLNGGDDGLRGVLDYLCRRGKLLILELQSWKKYQDQVRRLKRSRGEVYEYYDALEWRGKDGILESCITNYILEKGFELLQESEERNEFDRKIWIFEKK